MKFTIEFEGMNHVDDFVKKVAPEVVELSQRAAINRTISKVRSRSLKGVSKAAGIQPQKLLNPRFRLLRSGRKFKSGSVLFIQTGIPVDQMANRSGVQWNRNMAGAKVRGKTYTGTFAAMPTKGRNAGKRKRIYDRVSKSRVNNESLHVKRISLKPYGKILTTVGRRVSDKMLVSEFHKQMKWRLRSKGYTS